MFVCSKTAGLIRVLWSELALHELSDTLASEPRFATCFVVNPEIDIMMRDQLHHCVGSNS